MPERQLGDLHEVIVRVDLKPHDVYTPFQWNRPNLLYWVLILAASWVIYDSYSSDPEKWRLGGVPSATAAFGLIGALCLALLAYQYLLVLRWFQKYPTFKGSRDLRFDAEGVHIQSEHARGDYKWSLFSKVIETRRNFLFLQTATAAMYIPKRCFSSTNDVVRLRGLVLEYFKGRRRLRPE